MTHTSREGLSLLEMAIVLVIVGLLAGGVVAGKTLIRSAELRHVLVELESHKAAVKTFRERYKALPGDMRNATDFWGTDTGCGSTGETVRPEVCNGNGDGRVGGIAWTGSCGGSLTLQNEQELHQFWKQLASAGLVGGSYTGLRAEDNRWKIGVNTPVSEVGVNMSWRALDADDCDSTLWNEAWQGQALAFGAVSGNDFPEPVGTLTPAEAWGIDRKIDDGFPGKGSMRAKVRMGDGTTAADCADSGTSRSAGSAEDAEYNLTPPSSAQPKCALYFPNALD